MRTRPDQIINGFDVSYYLLSNPDVAAAGVDPLTHFLTVGWQEGRKPNAVFDPLYYLAQNPDVAAAGVNPLLHYLQSGASEGRDPSAAFDTDAYLAANPDVAAAGINPMLHYLQHGAFEGRPIAGNLTVGSAGSDFLIGTAGADTLNGLEGNDFVIAAGGNDTADGGTGIDTVRFSGNFTDYTFTFTGNDVIVDGPEGHDTFRNFERFAFQDATFARGGNELIDDFYYYAQNPDVYAAGVDATSHFLTTGWKEGRNPNAFFDVNYYLTNNPDVAAAGIDPLVHYMTWGWHEGRNPSAQFDTAAYLAANPDVAAAGVNPLEHFLEHGGAEGRSPLGAVQTSVSLAEDIDHVFVSGDFDVGSLGSVQSVTIDASGITHGTLFIDANNNTEIDGGEALTGSGNVVLLTDIDAGRLIFRPDADDSGNGYATFGYVASDGSNTAAPGVMTIDVTPVNDAPVVDAAAAVLSYSENQAAAAIDSALTLSDVDSGNLTGATVSITANFASGQDTLGFTTQSGITGSYNSSSGVLTLSGTATVAQYQAALRSVTYANSSENPSTATRTIGYQVDDGQPANHASNVSSATVTVAAVNDAPAVNAQGASVSFTENGAAVAIATALTVSDIDSTHLTGASVTITANFAAGQDLLNFTNQNGITGSYNSGTGVLTLSGSATLADYQTALRSITYSNSSNGPSTAARTISFQVDDGQSANHASTASTASVAITPVNDAPSGANKTVTTDEDVGYTFAASDFGFSDAADGSGANTLQAVIIHQIPTSGTLTLATDGNPVAVQNGDVINVVDIPNLVFTPDADDNGTGYATFTFSVQDNGGTANGGSNTESASHTITIDVNAVNDAPREIAFAQTTSANVIVPVPEGSTSGDFAGVVGVVSAIDVESNGITYSIVDANGNLDPNSPFQINPTTGEITISATANPNTFDYEADLETHSYSIIVQASDGTASSRQTISILLGDVTETNGSVIEGYIKNATVTIDDDGIAGISLGDYTTTTDDFGNFKIFGTHVGDMYLTGGVDIATNLAFTGTLKAPSGSSVLSPITTLIAALAAASNISIATATAQVTTKLGLPPGVDYANYDPISASLQGDTNGDAVFAAGVQLYSTIVQASALITGTDNAVSADDAASAVLGAIVTQLQNNATVSLSNSSTVEDVITGAAATTATDVSANTILAASLISGSNGIIQSAVDAPGTTGADLLKVVVGAATVAQDGVATALSDAGGGNTSAADNYNTGTNLSDAVGTAAQAVDVSVVAGSRDVTGTDGPETLSGQAGDDNIFAGGGKDLITGSAGSDTIYGDTLTANGTRSMAADRVDYSGLSGHISVQLASGQVTKFDAAGSTQTGTDTLFSIEFVRGTAFDDSFVATGYSGASTNGGGVGYTFTSGIGALGNTNEFEGMDGNDTITGNGATRVSYQNALGKVAVNLQTGTAFGYTGYDGSHNPLQDGTDAAGIGVDTITGGVVQVRGSNFDDYIKGRSDNGNATEMFDGLGGDDFIDGNGGFDRVRYDYVSPGALGIIVDLGRGTVTGRDAAATAVVGHDDLRSIESVRGSNSADIFDATNFSATGNVGLGFVNFGGSGAGPLNQGNFNEFEGLGGDDSIIGNGNTRLAYYSSTSGVTVVETGIGTGTASGDASVGFDTYSGVTNIRGSNFADTFTGFNNGTNNFETFEGWAGDDLIDGGLGLDKARYDGNNGDAQGHPVTVGMHFDMASGIASAIGGNADTIFNYGTDTLRGIEAIRGTTLDDEYVATGFGAGSQNAGGLGDFNEFEGGLGNDTVTGNGSTRVNYQNAGSNAGNGVNVNLGTGATGTDGTDTFVSGVNAVRGSNFNDALTGTNNVSGTTEFFEGMGGTDNINGMGGFDVAKYEFQNTNGVGIVATFTASAASVRGVNNNIGVDTITNVESFRGTNFADTYNATGYTANTGFGAGFNEFEGLGGNDDITGNGNTRITYQNALGGVNVDLVANSVIGSAGSDTLHGGINAVRGSQFADAIRGSAGNDTLQGNGGNDAFVYLTSAFGNDTITDFAPGAGTDDFIQFDDTVFANFDAVIAAAAQVGFNTVITVSPGNTITLLNVTLGNLHQTDFLFT